MSCVVPCLAGGPGSPGGVDPEATSAMIEKEKHKLEVLKRRQERDIQQVRRLAGLWQQALLAYG